jgi:hypothetical protein
MKLIRNLVAVGVLACALRCASAAEHPATVIPDPRHLANGWNIPSEGYADQPYIVKTDDGAWLCVMTTGKGVDGTGGHHVVITVDGGPKIITFVVDGVLCDGGDQRQFGWGRFSPTLRTPNGAATAKVASAVRSLRFYNRVLRTSEAVGNYRAGLAP